MYLDLPQLAKHNEPYLLGEAERILGAAENQVSINIGLGQLLEVPSSGSYFNIFELGSSVSEIEARYNRRELYFPKLMAFAALFPSARMGKAELLLISKRWKNS